MAEKLKSRINYLYDVYAVTYKNPGVLTPIGYTDLKGARELGYEWIKKYPRNISEVAIYCNGFRIGAVYEGTLEFKGKVIFQTDYVGKKLLKLKYHYYILNKNGTLGKPFGPRTIKGVNY